MKTLCCLVLGLLCVAPLLLHTACAGREKGKSAEDDSDEPPSPAEVCEWLVECVEAAVQRAAECDEQLEAAADSGDGDGDKSVQKEEKELSEVAACKAQVRDMFARATELSRLRVDELSDCVHTQMQGGKAKKTAKMQLPSDDICDALKAYEQSDKGDKKKKAPVVTARQCSKRWERSKARCRPYALCCPLAVKCHEGLKRSSAVYKESQKLADTIRGKNAECKRAQVRRERLAAEADDAACDGGGKCDL